MKHRYEFLLLALFHMPFWTRNHEFINMLKSIHFIAIVGICILAGCNQGIDHTVIYSTDEEVSFELSVVGGQLVYSTLFRDSSLIETSEIEFSMDSVSVTDNVEITGIEKYSGEERYEWMGAHFLAKEARTWPNELTREAIRGMEASKLEDCATHNTTVPFTRFLAGHAEYTPVHFGECRKNTTWTHQIASASIMYTPLLTYAANPAQLLDNPAVEIIRQIPSYWDETIVLDPSEITSYARRKNEVWFLAIMNGAQPRPVDIPLNFLPSGEFVATMAKDDPMNAASMIMEEGSLNQT
ncbi:hypothetical protein J2X69_002577 [Algoriphagus sp. 4150]|uniref:glycoside hydrolase family 97 catalytic domain-containing protein n=1 Tax=Algoriphagus sp. 4150 TaxID=2817756 RepID=UPI0028617181|nr:glycoside hydrolase family 97 catalytic domain-containing protein [Algoriphagus sp. 4150]MDR7130229.1 hypothetical protein [Algoriphagus sp. 4150]